MGLGCGLAFGFALLTYERSRRLQELRLGRFALWGAVAGGTIPLTLFIGPILAGANAIYFGAIIVASAAAGAAWATVSLRLARGRSAVAPANAATLLP